MLLGGLLAGFVASSILPGSQVSAFSAASTTWDASTCAAGVFTVTSTATPLSGGAPFVATSANVPLPQTRFTQWFTDLPPDSYVVRAVSRAANGTQYVSDAVSISIPTGLPVPTPGPGPAPPRPSPPPSPAPSPAPTPTPGLPPSPKPPSTPTTGTPSLECTRGQTVTDGALNVFAIGATGFISRNGLASRAAGVELLYARGQVYIRDLLGSGQWWEWLGGDPWPAGNGRVEPRGAAQPACVESAPTPTPTPTPPVPTPTPTPSPIPTKPVTPDDRRPDNRFSVRSGPVDSTLSAVQASTQVLAPFGIRIAEIAEQLGDGSDWRRLDLVDLDQDGKVDVLRVEYTSGVVAVWDIVRRHN